jgi:DNA-binding cell septation regulator SpoVG
LLRGSQLIYTQSKTDNAEIARDMMHPGPKQYRENVAPLFVKAYNNENYNVDLGYGES